MDVVKGPPFRRAISLLILTIAIAGCLRPVSEFGTVHTPVPTPSGAEWQERLSPETLKDLIVPRECVREMPLRMLELTSLDLSPSGEWLVGSGRSGLSLGTPHPFVFFYNLETRESRILPRSVPSDIVGELNYSGVEIQWDGKAEGIYYQSMRPGRDKLYHLRLSDGRVQELQACSRPNCSIDVAEPLGLVACVCAVDGGYSRQNELEVWRWGGNADSRPLVALPVPQGAYHVKLSPTGKRVSFLTKGKDEQDEKGYSWPTWVKHYVDLASRRVITLGQGDLDTMYAWLTDDVVLRPNPKSLKVWKYDLETNNQEVFVEFAADALVESDRKYGGLKHNGIESAMIAGRNRQYLLFVPLANRVSSTLHLADLGCALDKTRHK